MIIFPLLYAVTVIVFTKLNIEINLNIAGLHFNYHYLLLLSVVGVFSLLYVCRYIEKIPIVRSLLIYCSRASFFILAYHIFIKDVFAIMFDLENYNPLLHTILFFINIMLCCTIYMFLKKVTVIRIFFYPIKTIELSEIEIKIVNVIYINKYIPKEFLLNKNMT